MRRRGFVLDGFPRTVAQATALDAIMDGRGPLVVVDIVVPEDELVRRLARAADLRQLRRRTRRSSATTACAKCGGALVQRTDDNDAVVRERLKVYHAADAAARRVLPARPTFRSIDGAQPPDVVTAAMDAAIREASVATPGGVRL